MPVEGDLQTALGALVSGRAYPVEAPEFCETPYIVYTVISNIPELSLDGPTGAENRRMQIDIWGGSYGAVKALEVAVKAAMAASLIVNVPISIMDGYEPETRLHRVMMEYSVWTV